MYSLPVIVCHQVNNLGDAISVEQFDEQMSYLKNQGYRTIFLKDWIQQDIVPDGKMVAITFDEGYLDNWVYDYPILKKYGLKATIFIVTVRNRTDMAKRANLEDVWNRICEEDVLPVIRSNWDANKECVCRDDGSDDFVNLNEMLAMEGSGLIDIQSHSHYHRDYYVSDQIVDFNQNKYFGLGWATDGDTRYGILLYPRESAMMARRYFDDKTMRDVLAEKVRGVEYFTSRNKRCYLLNFLELLKGIKRFIA